ncbi:hypothetical protein [Brevibacillus laterosporus]|uniref:hypothetical protein n=1 Tax=Brevibacillus laterosporus TaxID=1465 RepID=UPI000839B55A|nr:hypothetical protein [Brevibacillus laterosporus]
MADVIVVKGAVEFPITIDPSVWVFDDRKFELSSYKEQEHLELQETNRYIRSTSLHWEKEMKEGATPPSQRKSLVEERKVLEGDYAIKFAPFLENAKPHPNATTLRIHRDQQDYVDVSLEKSKQIILQFSKDGKPIRDEGPVFLYFPEDLQENKQPLHNITMFEVLL